MTSSIEYSCILPGTDIKYTLVSNNIKEDIIINELSNSYSYCFEILVDGLSVSYEKGKIIFINTKSLDDIYYYPIPFMYDDNEAISYDVAYDLEKNGQCQYKLTVTADNKWINSDERKLPITIDPSLTDIGQTDDTFVASVLPTGINFGTFSTEIWS